MKQIRLSAPISFHRIQSLSPQLLHLFFSFIGMRKKLFVMFFFLLGGFSTKAQLITFDDQGHTNGQALPNPYTIVNNGETFLFTISGGATTNHIYRTTEGSCGSTGMSHLYAGNLSQTTWTIETTSGNEIDLGTIKFDNVFSCFSGFSYSLTIEGFKNNVSTGTQSFTVPGLNAIFTSNTSFDDVDKIVITAADLAHLGIDDINWDVALPVELVSFTAKEEKGLLSLNWRTASEFNNEKFHIEASRDGLNFEKIGEVKGKGTSVEQQIYSFNIENSQKGITYYRLKQIDYDGQYEYSKIINVILKDHNKMVVKPNPSSGMIKIEGIRQGQITIMDTTGKVVKEQFISGEEVDISDLPMGLFFIQVLSGNQIFSEQIIKSSN